MVALLSTWSHLLAAALYGGLAILQLRHWNNDPLNRPLVTAFAVVSVWAIFLALLDPNHLMTQLAESARNLAFLAFMYGILQTAEGSASQRAVKWVYAAVAAVVGLQIMIGGVIHEYRHLPLLVETLVATRHVLGLTLSAGALVLVHNLYGQVAPASRGALRLPMLALAAMWGYELHLNTVGYFTRGPVVELHALRGALLALLAPVFALGIRATSSWKVQMSRAATFQSISIIVILLYLVVMISSWRAMEIVGGNWGQVVQLGLLSVMTLAAFALLASTRARAYARVWATRHLFEHRYDYRAEWLRFTDTMGREGANGAPLEERVVKALADLGGSPAGLLLQADMQYRFVRAADWNWSGSPLAPGDGAELLGRFVEAEDWVLDLDSLRTGWLEAGDRKVPVPGWLAGLETGWAGIPLVHSGRLIGIVILAHPPFRRRLDWEDYDLFRAAGIQAASYLAEARSQQALADSRRFDEFNRRFAFILHDIKNLVSQLSLVARNAERHADNPEFRADMIATLQASVKKLNDLMARLSPQASRTSEPPAPVAVEPLIRAIVAAKRRAFPIVARGSAALTALADRAGLEQAIVHLVQNAAEASPAGEPVELDWFESGGDVAIEIADRGAGMDEQFVRTRLFQPFVSTKTNGFGIGAYEARALVQGMGGRLDVESAPGEGTRFTLFLPRAELRPAHRLERMHA